MTTTREDLDVKLVAVETRVGSLSQEQHRLNNTVLALQTQMQTGFDSIRAAIAARSETPWAILIAAAMLILAGMSTVGWLARQPLVDGQVSIKEELKLNAELRRSEDRRIADRVNNLQSQVDRIDGFLSVMRSRQQ